MYEKAKVNVAGIPELLKKYRGTLLFKPEINPYFVYKKLQRNKKEKDEEVLEKVYKIIEDIYSLIEEQCAFFVKNVAFVWKRSYTI